ANAGGPGSAASGRVVGPGQRLWPAAARNACPATAADLGRSDAAARLHGRSARPAERIGSIAAVAAVPPAVHAFAPGRLPPGDPGTDAAVHDPGRAGRALWRHLGVAGPTSRTAGMI